MILRLLVLLVVCSTSFGIPTGYQKASAGMRLGVLPDGFILRFNTSVVIPARISEGKLSYRDYVTCYLGMQASNHRRVIKPGSEFKFKAGSLEWGPMKDWPYYSEVRFTVVSNSGFPLSLRCTSEYAITTRGLPNQLEIFLPDDEVID